MQISIAGGRDVASAAGVSRVLLLGARLASHDLAGMFQRLVAPSPGRLHFDQLLAPSLTKAWNSDGTLSVLNLGWDLVMMVESAARIALQPERFASIARVLCVAARAVGGAVALVEPPPAPLCGGDAYRVRAAVESAALVAHAEVLPVGNVWRTALGIRPDLPLQTPRGRVSLLGAYLVACTLAHYVVRDRLHVLDLPGVRPAEAAFVHRVAHDLVLGAP
jgi:hypothetical protein